MTHLQNSKSCAGLVAFWTELRGVFQACSRGWIETSTPRLRLVGARSVPGKEVCLSGEFQQLINRECEHAEHQMGHDLAGAAHADDTRSELIF